MASLPRGFLTLRVSDLSKLDHVASYLRTRRGPPMVLRVRGGIPVVPARLNAAFRIQGPIRARPVTVRPGFRPARRAPRVAG